MSELKLDWSISGSVDNPRYCAAVGMFRISVYKFCGEWKCEVVLTGDEMDPLTLATLDINGVSEGVAATRVLQFANDSFGELLRVAGGLGFRLECLEVPDDD